MGICINGLLYHQVLVNGAEQIMRRKSMVICIIDTWLIGLQVFMWYLALMMLGLRSLGLSTKLRTWYYKAIQLL